MDSQYMLAKLASGQPFFDSIPAVVVPRICGLENEYGSIGLVEFEGTFLNNGGLNYWDCGHFEHSTPEVSNPLSAVLYSEAGKLISAKMCRRFELAAELFCHTSSWKDENGSTPVSFGAHESYATKAPRNIWDKLVPFFVARTVLCGSGWLNSDNTFEISQRARFMTRASNGDTQTNRSIVANRNESLMGLNGYDRLHIICGDATMSEVSTLLRLGTTSLLLEMLECGALPEVSYDTDKAASDMRGISRKMSDWYLSGLRGRNRNLLALLSLYQERAASLFSKRDQITDFILLVWKDTLEKLGNDLTQLRNRLDWVAKFMLLKDFSEAEQCSPDRLRDMDLEYHRFFPNQGLYHYLRDNGMMERLFTPELISQATEEPPFDTRAYIRGKTVQLAGRFDGMYQVGLDWGSLALLDRSGQHPLFSHDLPNPFENYAALLETIKALYFGSAS